jgi:hypothetical protein
MNVYDVYLNVTNVKYIQRINVNLFMVNVIHI